MTVDVNNWVPVLFNIENSDRAETELKVRVTAVLVSDGLSLSFPRYHLIRLAGASLASYQQDRQGRHSVIFPVSSSAATYRKIKFTSLSSDLGNEMKTIY
jgi:hypothetical protein